MKLSILVPSVAERRKTFLPKSLEMIYGQLESLPDEKQVEILYLIDNKTQMLGHKRNRLVDIAQGEYVAFVDDDDKIADNYIKKLLEAIDTGADVITFTVEVSLNGEQSKPCYYSVKYEKDYNTQDAYFRLPNHICCVKRSLAVQAPYPSVKRGEDSTYAKILKHLIKIEHKIEETLYYYNYNDLTTVAQEDLPGVINKRTQPICDVIFLSDGKNKELIEMTQRAINTCLSGASSLPVKVWVVESSPNVKYQNATTISPTPPFNYNRYANYGISLGSAKYVMVANNDLIFDNHWLVELIKADHPVVSPKCPYDGRQTKFTENTTGTETGRYFSGWCFMMERKVWQQIGGLDEDVTFWCSDDATIEQVKKIGIEPMIVPSSSVRHLVSTTLRTVSPETHKEMTQEQVKKFNKKYNKNKFGWGI